MEGCLFQSFKQDFAIHHADDFCQPCKKLFRDSFGIRFDRLQTFMTPERYPGCPINERFALVCTEPSDTNEVMRTMQATNIGRPQLYGFFFKPSPTDMNSRISDSSRFVFWEIDSS